MKPFMCIFKTQEKTLSQFSLFSGFYPSADLVPFLHLAQCFGVLCERLGCQCDRGIDRHARRGHPTSSAHLRTYMDWLPVWR